MSKPCSPFSENVLSDYTDSALSPLTQRRVRRHLARCRNCAARLAGLQSLNHAARNLYADAPVLPTPAARTRRVPVRLILAGTVAATAAAVWFAPEMPGRPRVAFADVENAMRHVKTAHWKSVHTIYDAGGKQEQQLEYDHWARLEPALYATRQKVLFPHGSSAATRDEVSRITEDESVLQNAQGRWYHIKATAQDRAKGVKLPVRATIDTQLLPPDAVPAAIVRQGVSVPAWKQENVTVAGRALLHFQRTLEGRNFRRTDEAWVEPTTHRLFRRTLHQTFYREASDGIKRPWRLVTEVASDFRYNEAIPRAVLTLTPPLQQMRIR